MSEIITIGRHRLLCGDITKGAVDDLMGDEKADLVYCDPPWGSGALQLFATMAEPGSSPWMPWLRFLDAMAQAIAKHRKPDAPVFIEMGMRFYHDLDEAMAGAGLPVRFRWTMFYGGKTMPTRSTVAIYCVDPGEIMLPSPPHGIEATRAIIRHVAKPDMVVLDPCCGLGMTAKITHELGGSFRGVELVESRLERTAGWLRRRSR